MNLFAVSSNRFLVFSVSGKTLRGAKIAMNIFRAGSSLCCLFKLVPAFCALNISTAAAQAAEPSQYKFDFSPGKLMPGYTRVAPTNLYTREIGYGFEPGAALSNISLKSGDTFGHGACASDKPFYFSVALPEGNYQVIVTLGAADNESVVTIKAELRRLMLEKIRVEPGATIARSFCVNIRTPKIIGDGEVKLKPREQSSETWAWDEKMTLEFNGIRPAVCSLEIEGVDNLPTVYILGDSTVCDQPQEPWNSWGQMLPRFFKPDVVVANHAESGETLRSSLAARRLDKVLSTMRPGDYFFIQYGHNDMKDTAADVLTTYKLNLKRFVSGARQKSGIPVLVTSMERQSGVEHGTLGDYPETVREVARQENVTLIDLNAMSKVLYKALGPELGRAFQDGTHHNNYGSYELAKCIVQGIKSSKLDLATHIVADFSGFDPSHPDSPDTFQMPVSPGAQGPRPLGD